MQDILNEILQMFSTHAEVLIVAVATGIATTMVFILRQLFSLLSTLTSKTTTALDDTLVQKIKEIFKGKVGEM